MGVRWNQFGFWFQSVLGLILLWGIRDCWSVNDEGLTLLEFRSRVTSDPYDALSNWNHHDSDPCTWLGVHCVNGKVQKLDLNGLSLEGTLVPELGKLSHLKYLVLCKNHFYGTIPKDIEGLLKLELLDLRGNNLTGSIPEEISRMLSLKHLLLCDNKFEGSISLELEKDRLPSKLQVDDNITPSMETGIGCLNRKFGHCLWHSNFKKWNKADSLIIPYKGALTRYLNSLPLPLPLFKLVKDTLNSHQDDGTDNLPSSSMPHNLQNVENLFNFSRRRLLEQSSNLPAAPLSVGPTQQILALPSSRSSGAFPAVPNDKKQSPLPSPADHNTSNPDKSTHNPSGFGTQTNQQHQADGTPGNLWKYIIFISGIVFFIIAAAVVLCMWKSRGATTIGPWKTGLSGQLQKAFVTGVPKLNRAELETACEDFSNIIDTFEGCTIYKGTLSSGVEIAVASTEIASSKDWSKNFEMTYRKKIDTLSRVNHKNFVNLLGYCEEEEPFTRMMVFEYAPNGTLLEHLHVKEVEHLDWTSRMRIIMGTAYCLQYMHHDLNPPVAHSGLSSAAIFLTDDYASKIVEVSFGKKVASAQTPVEDESGHSVLPPLADPETNIYDFGILLLEIISGKLPYSKEQGHLVNWAAEYLNDKRSISYLIDPTLKSFKNNELDVICEVIKDCIQSDPRLRPTMRDITSKLREVISISPDQAVPRLSPLWWAELEILSVEAT
ncbi:putative Receptor protein kinase [Quillaja saponaria]|uniref:Receptor protein kinase n=1 Tax=Quillaja saponaria TaxID=32244 RepID=A0AAD7PVV3_QUISA|nr:putative Receptor protein kinase [Quillaja saponaria]